MIRTPHSVPVSFKTQYVPTDMRPLYRARQDSILLHLHTHTLNPGVLIPAHWHTVQSISFHSVHFYPHPISEYPFQTVPIYLILQYWYAHIPVSLIRYQLIGMRNVSISLIRYRLIGMRNIPVSLIRYRLVGMQYIPVSLIRYHLVGMQYIPISFTTYRLSDMQYISATFIMYHLTGMQVLVSTKGFR